MSVYNSTGLLARKCGDLYEAYRGVVIDIKYHLLRHYLPGFLYWAYTRRTFVKFNKKVSDILNSENLGGYINWVYGRNRFKESPRVDLPADSRRILVSLIEELAGRKLSLLERLKTDWEIFCGLRSLLGLGSLWHARSYKDMTYHHPSSAHYAAGEILKNGGLVAYLDAYVMAWESGEISSMARGNSREEKIRHEATDFMNEWLLHAFYLGVEFGPRVEGIMRRVAVLAGDPRLQGCRCHLCLHSLSRRAVLEAICELP